MRGPSSRARLVEVAGHVLGVHHCDQSVQAVLLRELVVQEERLHANEHTQATPTIKPHRTNYIERLGSVKAGWTPSARLGRVVVDT